ncbi:GPR1/FUN34/YaaH family transporter [Saccharopolyspora sp. WRP15-2]|uniref:GPR1/FUN34/YaaH family transporter n=1 Tax=Saccharopolyspora oryzae TaxID=2997343 RepID=A0ABT4UUH1_9PSEU|nr:GPR1/FUN34/YaaH family transporter [Saccharopolyspora oryzae]MDA3624692.1 GPR1/FUN34/YaaH family transporter [Saccharopolyspora oryzae]
MSQESTKDTAGTAEPNDVAGAREQEHTQISLSPVAPPSILGLYGFAAAAFMVAANLAGWFGTGGSPLVLFPFAMVVGGFAQFLATTWSFRARDGLATAMHGVWGSFWIGYGIYMALVLAGLPAPAASPVAQVAFGYWFIALAAITWAGAAAATAHNAALTGFLTTLAAGSTLLAIGFVASLPALVPIGAVLLVVSALCAYYTATALLLQSSLGRPVLPLGTRTRSPAPIDDVAAEPGVQHGQ